MTYKVIFKRFRRDTDYTVVYIKANSAAAAAYAVKHFYCVGSDDFLSITPKKMIYGQD